MIETDLINTSDTVQEYDDISIHCIDCSDVFIWTIGEQNFYRAKDLINPPKRCKECKIAKNHRLDAIEKALVTGKPPKIEVKANCAKCTESTTVPFYPSQGRPVYCRSCYAKMQPAKVNGAKA